MFFQEMMAYYDAKLNETEKNFALSLESRDYDGIHDLRVGLKRMKAFFNMVEAIDLSFKAKKRFKPFKRIAKKAGGMRDAQVQQKLIRKLSADTGDSYVEYLDHLERMELSSYDTFKKFAARDPLADLRNIRKHIEKALESTREIAAETKAMGRFHNQKNNLVMLNSEPDLAEDTLHQVRKLSKEIHYTFELLQQCFHIFEDRDDFVAAVKKVHKVLGDWHDCDVSLGFLETFLETSRACAADKRYENLKKKLLSDKKALNRHFRSVLDDFNQTAAAF